MTSPHDDGQPPAHLVLLTALMTATGILANALLLPVLPDIVDTFAQDEAGGGLLLAVGSAPGILLAPFLGTAADRLGRRVIAVPSLVVFAFGGIGMVLARSWWTLLTARFVQGLGATALVSLAIVLIGDWYDGPTRTSRLALNAAVLTAAGAVAPLAGGLVGQRFGSQVPLLVSVVALPIAVLAARTLPRGAPARVTTGSGGVFGHIRADGLLMPILVGAALFVVYFGPTRAGATFALDERFGASTATRGLVLLIASTPSALVSLSMTRRLPRDAERAVSAGFLLFTAGLLAMAFAPTLAVFVLGAVLTGLAEGAIVPLLQSRISSAADPRHRAAVLATWASGVRIGQTGGPMLTGVVLRSASSSVLFTAAAALTAALAWVTSRRQPARPTFPPKLPVASTGTSERRT